MIISCFGGSNKIFNDYVYSKALNSAFLKVNKVKVFIHSLDKYKCSIELMKDDY